MSADDLAKQAADRVREVVEAAESRAEEIVAAARQEAAGIRERAESEARERLDEVRRALADLEGSIGAGGSERAAPPPPPEPGPEPEPPKRPARKQRRRAARKKEPPAADSSASSGSDDSEADAGAARLVAMKMALDGASRDEVDKHLADSYTIRNRKKLLDEVFARVG